MKSISHEELQVGMVVVITKAPLNAPGLADRLFTVMAIDAPYAVLRTGRGAAATDHMIKTADAEYAEPSRETLAVLMPSRILDAEYIEE